MKAFLPLTVPESHPFWTAEELHIDSRVAMSASHIAGMVFTHEPGHTTLLVSGPGTDMVMRGVPEKYQKFAYSSRYGFSVESDALGFRTGAFDSMIAFSDDDVHYRVREHCVKAVLAKDCLYSLWLPWKDVQVETWLFPRGVWHIRVHRILSAMDLSSTEGAFAAPQTDFGNDTKMADKSSAFVKSALGDFVGIVDCSEMGRTARVVAPHGNTSLMFPRTLVAQVQGGIRANELTVFACAVLAGPDGDQIQQMFQAVPEIPTIEECDTLIRDHGIDVEICKDTSRLYSQLNA